MHVVLAGASGLIGTALRQDLRAGGDTVTMLVRHPPKAPEQSRWAPEAGQLDPAVLQGADAVVCLSGAGVADHRRTESYKQTLLASRVETTGTLARAIAAHDAPVVFLSASAVGYYGDTGDEPIDESHPRGSGFLADLCEQWEAAAEPAAASGSRLATLRTGIVLARRGGFLKRLVPIVRMGVAGRLGNGRQYLPWITLADEISAIRFLLEHEIRGPVNLTGPSPVTNAEMISTLAKLLHRPAALPVPALALKIALGEFADDILGGQRALPRVLLGKGFSHQHTEVASALRWALEH